MTCSVPFHLTTKSGSRPSGSDTFPFSSTYVNGCKLESHTPSSSVSASDGTREVRDVEEEAVCKDARDVERGVVDRMASSVGWLATSLLRGREELSRNALSDECDADETRTASSLREGEEVEGERIALCHADEVAAESTVRLGEGEKLAQSFPPGEDSDATPAIDPRGAEGTSVAPILLGERDWGDSQPVRPSVDSHRHQCSVRCKTLTSAPRARLKDGFCGSLTFSFVM